MDRRPTLVRGGAAPLSRSAAVYALAGGALFACDLALYNSAVLRTTAANATLLGNNAPLFVGLGTWLLFKRRPARAFWIGLGLALSGPRRDAASGGGAGDARGNLMALGAAVFFAGYMLTTERARERVDTLTFSAIAAGQRRDAARGLPAARRAAGGVHSAGPGSHLPRWA
jgi:drug/metabolite transporter (DMT)-like permease